MKSIFKIFPAFMICATLAACGGETTTTTSTTDSTTLNGSPMGHTATDNTGAGIEGGTITDGIDPQSAEINSGTSNTRTVNTGTSGSGGNTGTSGNKGETNTGKGGTTRSSTNTNRDDNPYGAPITKEDSISNRSGLAPVK